LERHRHNCVRSRNARLATLRSFLKFAAHRDVSSLQVIERALGVPTKRFERPMLGFLSRKNMQAVIDAPAERVNDFETPRCINLVSKSCGFSL
jgi:site-specific recombinase XerD